MIDKRLIPVAGLKKEPFSGSHLGMRYLFQCEEDKEHFCVYLYPEPWSFEKTPEEEKEKASFPMTEEGMDTAVSWILERFEAQREKWLHAAEEAMHTVQAR